MQWLKKDLESYLKAKEYIDTIIMPLIPFEMSNDQDVSKTSYQREVLKVFSSELEKELSGRIMLVPDYYYVKSTDKEKEVHRINGFISDIQKQPFTHIFFITFDSLWKKHEQTLNGHLLWLPGLHSGNLYSEEMQGFIHDQVTQISELIRSYW